MRPLGGDLGRSLAQRQARIMHPSHARDLTGLCIRMHKRIAPIIRAVTPVVNMSFPDPRRTPTREFAICIGPLSEGEGMWALQGCKRLSAFQSCLAVTFVCRTPFTLPHPIE